MVALVIVGKGDISPKTVSEVITLIQRTESFEAVDVSVLSDIEVQQALVAKSYPERLFTNRTNTKEVINFDEIKAATVFLTTTFGNPLDNEDAFRVRVQKCFWSGEHDEQYRRIRAALEIFSKIHNAKIPPTINKYLKENGMQFMSQFCNMLFRYENM